MELLLKARRKASTHLLQRQIYKLAITAAQTVDASTSVTQAQVDTATGNLTTALATFQALVVAPIDAADLVAYWSFNEGTGTKATDVTGNGHDGTLTAAATSVGQAGVPTWVADRHNAAAQALHFTDGSHVEVPVSSALVPSTAITLTLWVYMDSLNTSTGVNKNDYMISSNDYNTYKFQTQEAKKPFFTFHGTTNGSSAYYDRDTNNGLKNNLSLKKWYHFAVAYNSATGTEVFYVNGQSVWTWTDVSGTITNTTPQDLFIIGANYSNAYYTANPYTVNSDGSPAPVFFGALDEVRVFKAALTDAQVLAIYNQEK